MSTRLKFSEAPPVCPKCGAQPHEWRRVWQPFAEGPSLAQDEHLLHICRCGYEVSSDCMDKPE